MPEPKQQATWTSHLPTSTGRQTGDGRRIYRLVPPQVTWWAWVVVAVLSISDLAIQGHDLSSLRFALGVLAVTGLVYACALWPSVVAGEDGMTVQNPFRCYDIPWGAVKGIVVADSVQVRCAREPPKKDKTVYSWALSSSRRKGARAEMRARQWDRSGGRNRPAGWDRMPESAKEIAKMTPANLIATELASIARHAQGESQPAAEPDAQAKPDAQAESPSQADVVSGRWAWPPLAAVVVPTVAFTIVMLV